MQRMTTKIIIPLLFFTCICKAQEHASQERFVSRTSWKTNLLYDLTTTFNMGIELKLGNRTTLDLPVNYNPWTFSGNRKFKHWLFQPGVRFWKSQAFRGSFWGIHGHVSQFNTQGIFGRNQYEGWLTGGGISYGYRWNLSGRWAMEAEIGAGYAYISYDKYEEARCHDCGRKIKSASRNYFGVTKAAVSLVYTFGKSVRRHVSERVPLNDIHTWNTDTAVVQQPVTKIDTVFLPSRAVTYRYENGSARIFFPVNQSGLNPDIGNNRSELAQIAASLQKIRTVQGAEIRQITIGAYSSPEGEEIHNAVLAEKRADALKSYLAETCDVPVELITVNAKGENWNSLATAISETDHLTDKDKDELLRILRTENPAERKQKLKIYRGGEVYKWLLREVYPALRVCEYQIGYSIPDK